MHFKLSGFAIPMLIVGIAQAGELGPAYTVTSYLATVQDFIGCSRAANGDTLTAWRSATTARVPYLKRLDARGAVLGGVENAILPADTLAVAANKVGSYFVLSTQKNSSGYADLYGSVYNRAGTLVAGPFRINDTTHAGGTSGTVKAAPDGTFTVGWTGWANLQPYKVYARRFSASGSPITAEKLLTSNSSYAFLTGIDTDPSGVVVAAYSASDGSNRVDTYMIRYTSPTGWISAPVRVNTYLGRSQPSAGISMNSTGNYVITWSTYGQDGAGYSTYAQFFGADGSKVNGSVKVSTALSDNSTNPNVALFDNNSYAVSWLEDINYAYTFKLRQVGGPYSGFVGNEATVSPALPVVSPGMMCGDTSGNIAVKWRDYRRTPDGVLSDVYTHDYVADSVPPVTALENNQQVTALSDQTGSWKYFKLEVPANTSTMQIVLSSQTQPASGNADLYLRYGGMPSASGWDTRTTTVGNSEGLSIATPPPGTFYIGVYGQAAYAGVALSVSYR